MVRFFLINEDAALNLEDIRSWRLVSCESNNERKVLQVNFKNGDRNDYVDEEAKNLYEILKDHTVGMI